MWLMPWLLLVTVLATEEVLSLLAAKGWRPVGWPVYFGALATMLAFAQPWWTAWFADSERLFTDNFLSWPLLAFTGTVGLIFAVEMRRFGRPGSHIVHIALAIFAIAYVGMLSGFMVALRLFGQNATGIVALVSMIAVTKLSDTGAYAFGRMFGARKLTPRLSPGKTWEGAMGGIVTACVVSWLFFRWIAPEISPPMATHLPASWATLLYGGILAIAGMTGDLAESLLKRDMERKDSSTWLPGLGGVLDIVDSLLFAGPAAYLCWELGLLT